MPKPRKSPTIAQQTLSRRTWLEWMGSTSVLALGAGLFARCDDDVGGRPDRDGGGPDAAGPGPDAGAQVDSGVDAATTPPLCTTETTFPYAPATGEAEVYQGWRVRTVDRQNIDLILDNWELEVDGLVSTPRRFSFEALMQLQRQDQITDFHCVEGWSVYDVPWNGVHLSVLMDLVKPSDKATYVTFHTIDGKYNESLPLSVALEPKTMLGYGVNCATLPLDHGFPLRLVVPRLLAYKNAKYIQRIELSDTPVQGYWVAAGYPYDGDVPEARLREGKY